MQFSNSPEYPSKSIDGRTRDSMASVSMARGESSPESSSTENIQNSGQAYFDTFVQVHEKLEPYPTLLNTAHNRSLMRLKVGRWDRLRDSSLAGMMPVELWSPESSPVSETERRSLRRSIEGLKIHMKTIRRDLMNILQNRDRKMEERLAAITCKLDQLVIGMDQGAVGLTETIDGLRPRRNPTAARAAPSSMAPMVEPNLAFRCYDQGAGNHSLDLLLTKFGWLCKSLAAIFQCKRFEMSAPEAHGLPRCPVPGSRRCTVKKTRQRKNWVVRFKHFANDG